MSENLPKPKSSQDEVDMGQLFKIIGNVFDRFFRFISSIFEGLYKVILHIMIHFKTRIRWYVIIGLIGLAIGYFLDKNEKSKTYFGTLYIKANLKSSYQIYENINFLNQYIIDNESEKLGENLDISEEEASALRSIRIESAKDQSEQLEYFKKATDELDSVQLSKVDFEKMIDQMNPYDYETHKITVISKDKFVYSKLKKGFIKSLNTNEYLQKVLNTNTENLLRKKATLEKQKFRIDSLIRNYIEIRKNESQRQPIPGSGSVLNLGDNDDRKAFTDESDLLERRLELDEELRTVYKDLTDEERIIRVFGDFPAAGYTISNWYDNKKLVLPILLLILTVSVFSLIGLNKYLAQQELRLNNK